jgi:hypothetical protein
VSAPVIWGVVGGAAVAASPLGFWWLPSATVYAFGIIVIASVYIGFSVADGRPKVIAVEVAVASTFVVVRPALAPALDLVGHSDSGVSAGRMDPGGRDSFWSKVQGLLLRTVADQRRRRRTGTPMTKG